MNGNRAFSQETGGALSTRQIRGLRLRRRRATAATASALVAARNDNACYRQARRRRKGNLRRPPAQRRGRLALLPVSAALTTAMQTHVAHPLTIGLPNYRSQ